MATVQSRTIDQAVLLSAAAALVEFLRQGRTFGIREACGGMPRRWPLCSLCPEFHCDLNFIARCLCRAERFAGGNCGYVSEALKATVLEALASASSVCPHQRLLQVCPACLHPWFLQVATACDWCLFCRCAMCNGGI